VTQADIEFLKSSTDRIGEIETQRGERPLTKPISVFDENSSPDGFFWDGTGNAAKPDSEQRQGYALPLSEMVSVRPVQL
jgi:hypothetical protein